MRALITGISGFAGGHLANWLLAHTDHEIWGTDRRQQRPLDERVHLVPCDLTQPEQVQQMVEAAKPDLIFHLAAQAHVGSSWQDPWYTFEQNVRSQVNLFQVILAQNRYPRILVIGSTEEYGTVRPQDLPIREDTPLRPESPYGLSKVAQDLMGSIYTHSYGLVIVRVRPFNHLGPGQAPTFAVPSFARQIARIEAGLQPPVLKVGNLSAARDFSDVRDIVRAYYLILTQGESGEVYNLGSGQAYTMQEILDVLLSFSNLPIRVEVDPARLRPVDIPILLGDISKVQQLCGWQPTIPLRQTLADLLEEWREKVRIED